MTIDSFISNSDCKDKFILAKNQILCDKMSYWKRFFHKKDILAHALLKKTTGKGDQKLE